MGESSHTYLMQPDVLSYHQWSKPGIFIVLLGILAPFLCLQSTIDANNSARIWHELRLAHLNNVAVEHSPRYLCDKSHTGATVSATNPDTTPHCHFDTGVGIISSSLPVLFPLLILYFSVSPARDVPQRLVFTLWRPPNL